MSVPMDNGSRRGRPLKLTPEIQTLIINATRVGAYAHVAAQAAGIAPATFFRWMSEEMLQHPDPEVVAMFDTFQTEVRKAQGAARMLAEKKVREDNPLAWLRFGPGREAPGNPGWTSMSKVELTGKDGLPLGTSAPVGFDPSKLSDEDLDQLERLLSKAQPDEPASGS